MLILEPFYGGSHKSLIETLIQNIDHITLVTLPAKKWHWRARCSALMMMNLIPKITTEKILFCSSVLNLSELLGLRPDLQALKKVVYFHENQLVYPVREIKDRDVQFAYNEITTCLVADIIIFNSNFNRISFLENINKIIKMFPDSRPLNIRNQIEEKCHVLYYPVEFPKDIRTDHNPSDILHILWPHRWEFDKNPDDFFKMLLELKNDGLKFHVSVLGESFSEKPPIFSIILEKLQDELMNFGYTDDKNDYYKILNSATVVVSTATHEFFGVSMMEAVYCGCYPIAPNRLVYPEIYPAECLYTDLTNLYEMLRNFCIRPELVAAAKRRLKIDFTKYSSKTFLKNFADLLE